LAVAARHKRAAEGCPLIQISTIADHALAAQSGAKARLGSACAPGAPRMAHREFPHVQSGRIVHVDELAARPAAELVGSSVRVLGR
jgi:hypothetical protein